VDDYFSSGRWAKAPTNVQPFASVEFAMCNKNHALTGCTGGTAFKLLSVPGGGDVDVAFGCTNPLLGAYKAAALWSDSAEKAYEASVDHTTKITKSFLGNRKDGTQVAYFIDIVATPGANASITITQHL